MVLVGGVLVVFCSLSRGGGGGGGGRKKEKKGNEGGKGASGGLIANVPSVFWNWRVMEGGRLAVLG